MKVKIIGALCASFLAAFILLSVLPVSGEGEIYSGLVRLHVIANSDSEADQALKLKVRDRILEIVQELSPKSKEDAVSGITCLSGEITAAAEAVLRENGCEQPVRLELGLEDYPEREYEGFTLPAGEYTSLRVIIGSGEGHNWWCVLYPPLCTAAAQERENVFISAGFTDEQYKTITETKDNVYKVKFKLLEIIEEILGMESSE